MLLKIKSSANDDIWLNIPLLEKLLRKRSKAIMGHVKDAVFNLQPIREATDNSRKVQKNISAVNEWYFFFY